MQIGFLLFPDVTQLDFTGPLQVLHRLPGATTHIVARTRDAVPSDCGLALVPTTTFDDCPPLDILCVPGGFGVDGALQDAETMAFVRKAGARARYVTSVCTGRSSSAPRAFSAANAPPRTGRTTTCWHGSVRSRSGRAWSATATPSPAGA